MHRVGDDSGTASIAIVGVVSVCLVLTVATVTTASALVARHRTGAGADAAALAAADVAAGLVAGTPCSAAVSVATANRVVVESCSIEGSTSTITVRAEAGILPIRVSATAGQPSGSSGYRSVGSKK